MPERRVQRRGQAGRYMSMPVHADSKGINIRTWVLGFAASLYLCGGVFGFGFFLYYKSSEVNRSGSLSRPSRPR